MFNNRLMHRLMVLGGSAICSTLLFAKSLPLNIADSAFPDARAIYSSNVEDRDYALALGPLKKINSEWRTEREQRLNGQLTRRTLELPESYSVGEAYRHLRAELQRHDARPLFICQGLDCGSSNAWANDYFHIKQLYGLDQNQYYGAWEVTAENDDVYYVTTYLVQRGNRRIYLQVDQVQVAQKPGQIVANPEALIEILKGQGHFKLSGVDWTSAGVDVRPEHLQALTQALQRDPWLKIRVVGHDYGAGELAQQQARSLAAAQKIRDALVKLGIKPDRVSAHGVGSLAPSSGQAATRIEIVRQ